MALKGTWAECNEMKTSNGQTYIVASINYGDKGSPWKMSTFDEGIIAEALTINEGDEVEFETKKSGNYTNIMMLNGVKALPKKEVKQKTKTKEVKADVDWDKIGQQKAFCGMMNACLDGYVTNNGEMPNEKWIDDAGNKIAKCVVKLMKGEYFREYKDGEIPF